MRAPPHCPRYPCVCWHNEFPLGSHAIFSHKRFFNNVCLQRTAVMCWCRKRWLVWVLFNQLCVFNEPHPRLGLSPFIKSLFHQKRTRTHFGAFVLQIPLTCFAHGFNGIWKMHCDWLDWPHSAKRRHKKWTRLCANYCESVYMWLSRCRRRKQLNKDAFFLENEYLSDKLSEIGFLARTFLSFPQKHSADSTCSDRLQAIISDLSRLRQEQACDFLLVAF